jgi:hypothetical protein
MIATQNSIMHLLVGKNIARTGSVTATDPTVSTYAADGEIVVTDLSGTVLDSTTVLTKDRIRIVQSQGATKPSIQSPIIERTAVKSFGSKLYTAPTLQVDYIGYNVTTNTGDIEVINDNGYEVLIQDTNSAAYGTIGIGKFGFYVSGSSATKAEIMDGLAISLYQNTARVVNKPFIVERVASVIAGTDTTGATGTLTFTNGSTLVTATVASGANGAIVGAYLKTDDAAVDTGVLYKITALPTATTFTIDQPYQGATATFTAGNASVYTAALLNAGSLGIKLTGLAPVFTSPQSTEPYVNRWSTTVRNGGTTTYTNQVGGTEGVGSYPYMASLEYFLIGNEGFIARNNNPYQTPRANILSSGTYNLLTLEWDSVKSGAIFNQQANSKQLLIAFDFTPAAAPTQVTGVVTAVQTVLNAWISTSIGQGTLA